MWTPEGCEKQDLREMRGGRTKTRERLQRLKSKQKEWKTRKVCVVILEEVIKEV